MKLTKGKLDESMPGIFDRVADHLKTKTMNEEKARRALIAKDPLFETRNQILQDVCIAGYMAGHSDGYDLGFEVAQIAERGIIEAQKKYDADLLILDSPQDLANLSRGSASFLDAVKVICKDYNAKILKP